MIAALTAYGDVAPMVSAKSINTKAFESYVEQCLAPLLQLGDIVVWDDLNVHKSAHAIELIEATGASVVFCQLIGF